MRRARSDAFAQRFQAANELQLTGRVRESVSHYRRAIRANGNVADVHNNLACAFLALGQLDEAALALGRALELRPDYAAALDNLGLVRARLEQHEEAVSLHKQAASLEPTNATTLVNLGNALLTLRRYAEAQAAFEDAIRRAPRLATAHNGLGIVLDRTGRSDEAEMAFRTALEANPNFGDAACNLGWVLLYAGDLDAAVGYFERALALEPRNGRFHLSLVLGRSGAVDDRSLSEMERLATEVETLPQAQRIDLHFALARSYEGAGRYDEAFRQLRSGNTLKRSTIRYDEAVTLQMAACLENLFTEPFVAALRGSGNPSARPIFVFGMPRSGTTLVEQMLAANPVVTGAGELSALKLAVRDWWPALTAGKSLSELRNDVRTIGDRYLSATNDLAGAARHLTDKMPGNFWYAPLIHLALPNARMIHVRRDRIDTCLSCFGTLFDADSVPFAYDLGELARYYGAYERVMEKWFSYLPADRFVEVHYERLVDDFETEARRIAAFCGLPWDPAVLAFHAVPRTVRTASSVQVRRPLYRSAVGRGRRFAAHLGPLVDAFTTRSAMR